MAAPAKRRCAKPWRATSAAAPATRTSSRPCRWLHRRWPAAEYRTEHTHMNARQGFIGQAVTRREDTRFLTGTGQYTDDINLPGQTYAYFLRSPYAHARITSLNTAAAAAAPGVVGIFTGEHFKAVGGLPCGW